MRARGERGRRRPRPRLKVGSEVVVVWGLSGAGPVARRGRVYSILYPATISPKERDEIIYRVQLTRTARGGKLHDIPRNRYKGSWKAHCERCPWDWLVEIR
jgi:hypothetical protein